MWEGAGMVMGREVYCVRKALAEAMNLARLAEVATICEKYALGKFQPPSDVMTFSVGCAD
jgi:hypothetical protein